MLLEDFPPAAMVRSADDPLLLYDDAIDELPMPTSQPVYALLASDGALQRELI